jgi:hypothetical protein
MSESLFGIEDARRVLEVKVISRAFRDAAVVLMPGEDDASDWRVGIGFDGCEREVGLEELLTDAIDDPFPGDDLEALRTVLVCAAERIAIRLAS